MVGDQKPDQADGLQLSISSGPLFATRHGVQQPLPETTVFDFRIAFAQRKANPDVGLAAS